MTCVLAIDVGTSSAKAGLYDARALAVEGASAQEGYTSTRGHSGRIGELDPDELLATVQAVLDEALAAPTERVDAVSTSCFWHSLLAVDRRGRPLTTVQTWRDVRSTPEAAELARRVDPADVHARTGAALHPSFWPAKLLRLRRREPEVFRSAARFLSFSDYLQGRLTGDWRTSLSMASGTGLLDLTLRSWDGELLAELELEPDRLPTLSDEPIERDGVPWFPALGDGACSNAGAGCTTRGRAALMIGTSAAIRTVHPDDGEPLDPGLFRYRLDHDRVVEGGSLSDGGNLHDWLERTLSLPEHQEVADRPPDGHGLTFLTLLGGERSPGWRAGSSGAIAGLTFATEPLDLLQAALEGVAMRFADILDLMRDVRELVATGGALLANPGWTQVIADVLERPLLTTAVREASARGAAALAVERLGGEPAPAPLGPTVEPRAERAEAYRAARERQRALYRALA